MKESDTSLDGVLLEELAALEGAGLRRVLRVLHGRHGARVAEGDHGYVDFSSNDYLGLATDPRVAGAAIEALRAAGTGATAARLISGHHELHAALEQALARFLDVEAALLFPSGYMANLGAIPALAERGDGIYADVLNHASLIDGCRLSRAERHVVPHLDVEALERAIARGGDRLRRRWIVVEGIYSMDGDLSPLAELVALARRTDAWIYLDDAHGVGVLGATGQGSMERAGGVGEIQVVMGTLGKAFGVAGAFVAGARALVDYLANRARAFVYSTGSPPALAAAARTALEIAVAEPERRDRLRANARALRAGLAALGWPPPGPEDGHIVPVVIEDSEEMLCAAAALRAAGFLVGAIRPPTVPKGTARLRLTVSAAHSADDVAAVLRALASALPAPSAP
ncbi:MAG TPA: 8-amino-7-oxononanoate synthase [Gemmatimonadales bacterium]|nr:8-amino-7-oxononanoate synthase [Gemmatimonadales bacterium]